MVSYNPAKFSGHRYRGSGNTMVSVCHVILQEHVIKGLCHFIPTPYGPFWGCSRMGGGKKTLPKICHTSHNDETWRSYTLPKEDPKNI